MECPFLIVNPGFCERAFTTEAPVKKIRKPNIEIGNKGSQITPNLEKIQNLQSESELFGNLRFRPFEFVSNFGFRASALFLGVFRALAV
jgi:hypothetical protein